MRGFRGSRAAQGFNAPRFAQHTHGFAGNGHSQGSQHVPHGTAVAPNGARLPDWLKTPETRACEEAEAKQQAKKPDLRLVPKPAPEAKKAAPKKVASAKKQMVDQIKPKAKPKTKRKAA